MKMATEQPRKLSEKEPGPSDLDSEGRCWWFHRANRGLSHPMLSKNFWHLDSHRGGEFWLPHWAIPLQPTEPDTEQLT